MLGDMTVLAFIIKNLFARFNEQDQIYVLHTDSIVS